ncbi:MAG: ArsR family transcriptional regulator [Chloroflexota bacterium]|nr:MAG: ArsR family transcriptional regulator [Chloroflexota bacterium]
MPAELQAELVQTIPATITFELEPAHNLLYSLLLLTYVEQMPGLDDWVTRTHNALSPERRHNNRLVLEGLHFAVVPTRSYNSFEEYLNDLEATDAVELRDRLLERLTTKTMRDLPRGVRAEPAFNTQKLLDKEAYIQWLSEKFQGDFDEALEREAHDYLTDPPRMKTLIVYHLQTMWRDVLRAEWQRVRPMLEEAVNAFRAQEFSRLSAVEVAKRVARQELKPYWEEMIQRARHLILIPSAHLGPYFGKFSYEDTLWLLFGAHLSAGMRTESSALTRSELVVRLSALNDDTRLRILELLSKREELCAQDVITLLDVSQPAASRHLKQLSATGYVTERRREGNKCYALNRERLDETCELLNRFLGRK